MNRREVLRLGVGALAAVACGGAGHASDDLEAAPLPEPHGALVRRDNVVELHRDEARVAHEMLEGLRPKPRGKIVLKVR